MSGNKIIAAFAGTGKTTLAMKYPDLLVDFVAMPYKYYLEDTAFDSESCKANLNNILQSDWPFNYIEAIKNELVKGKTLLIPSDRNVLSLLETEGLHYALCYPKRNSKEIYRKRYIDRGNTKEFLDVFIGRWDIFMDHLESDSWGQHFVLEPSEYLSDIIMKEILEKSEKNSFKISLKTY